MSLTSVLTATATAAALAAPGFQTAYESITNEDLAAHVAMLASNEFQGRAPGTLGETLTVGYLERVFREAGASPGWAGSYRQPVTLIEARRDGAGEVLISGPDGDYALTPWSEQVTFLGGPEGPWRVAQSRIVFGGFGIVAEEEDWNDYDGVDLAGATVVLFRGDPGIASGDGDLFDGEALSVHGLIGQKTERAAELGAAAVMIVHTEASAGWPWSLLEEGGAGAAQAWLRDDDDAHPTAVVQISEPAARALFAAAGEDFDALYEAAAARGFVARESALTATIETNAETHMYQSNNVVAMFPGREAPEECVVYTAHWDHMGVDEDADGDFIFNGAVDNATGTAALVELAQAYGALERAPRRSVYFVATTAEEKGLLGAQAFIDNAPCAPENIVAVLNMDAHFPFGAFDAMTVPGLGSVEIEDVLAAAAARIDRVLQPDTNPQAGGYFRSDHWPFIEQGVPALYAVGSPSLARFEADPSLIDPFVDYVTNGYHKVGDEYDPESWDMTGIRDDVRVFFETGLELSDTDAFPNFTEASRFRALRDAMRASPAP